VNILVCLKQILDPNIPSRDFRIDPEGKEAVRGDAEQVPNIFCENALETALQLRDATGGSITVVSVGDADSEDTLRKALAMKADRAALVNYPSRLDPPALAQILAAAARHLGAFDLVMVGRESGDWGLGQTGGLLAEELKLPFVGLVDHIDGDGDGKGDGDGDGDGLRLRRQTDRGHEVLEATSPLLVSVTNCEGNLPRIPKTRDVMKSYKKPLTTLHLDELGLSVDELKTEQVCLVELYVPEKEVRCEFMEGDSLDAQIDVFAERIAETVGTVGN
jgi:electron transfer flavoprotein beta subunit